MLTTWAARWNIPHAAVQELRALMGVVPGVTTGAVAPGSEAGVQNAVRIAAARDFGAKLMRNNTGAYQDERGNFIRYGLMNDSKAVNAICKSSDLIGITPRQCGCGRVFGVFTAIECKAPGWKFRESDQRAVAQRNFLNLVVSLGGIGKFISSAQEPII